MPRGETPLPRLSTIQRSTQVDERDVLPGGNSSFSFRAVRAVTTFYAVRTSREDLPCGEDLSQATKHL